MNKRSPIAHLKQLILLFFSPFLAKVRPLLLIAQTFTSLSLSLSSTDFVHLSFTSLAIPPRFIPSYWPKALTTSSRLLTLLDHSRSYRRLPSRVLNYNMIFNNIDLYRYCSLNSHSNFSSSSAYNQIFLTHFANTSIFTHFSSYTLTNYLLDLYWIIYGLTRPR